MGWGSWHEPLLLESPPSRPPLGWPTPRPSCPWFRPLLQDACGLVLQKWPLCGLQPFALGRLCWRPARPGRAPPGQGQAGQCEETPELPAQVTPPPPPPRRGGENKRPQERPRRARKDRKRTVEPGGSAEAKGRASGRRKAEGDKEVAEHLGSTVGLQAQGPLLRLARQERDLLANPPLTDGNAEPQRRFQLPAACLAAASPTSSPRRARLRLAPEVFLSRWLLRCLLWNSEAMLSPAGAAEVQSGPRLARSGAGASQRHAESLAAPRAAPPVETFVLHALSPPPRLSPRSGSAGAGRRRGLGSSES